MAERKRKQQKVNPKIYYITFRTTNGYYEIFNDKTLW